MNVEEIKKLQADFSALRKQIEERKEAAKSSKLALKANEILQIAEVSDRMKCTKPGGGSEWLKDGNLNIHGEGTSYRRDEIRISYNADTVFRAGDRIAKQDIDTISCFIPGAWIAEFEDLYQRALQEKSRLAIEADRRKAESALTELKVEARRFGL